MTGLAPESDAALEPVRKALRAAAQKQVSELRDDAGAQARALLDDARAEATRILTLAAQEGEAAARLEAGLRSAQARRRAQELVLAQRNSLRRELHRRAQEAAAGLKTDPRYPGLMTQLTDQCRELLGPDATVTESAEGGFIAEAGSRRLDLSLPKLAELTLDSMPEMNELWTR